MKNVKTNLEQIRNMAITFLYLDIKPEEQIPFVVYHPFTNSSTGTIKENNEFKFVNLLDETEANKWRKQFKGYLEKSSLSHIFILLNTPYRLIFLKHIMPYISREDCGKILNTYWTSIEAISNDVNVSTKDLVKIFKYADKKTLLDEDDYEMYKKLPNNIILYRGVTDYNKNEKKAMSYTTDIRVANWFATKRFNCNGKIWKIEIPKNKVLAVIASKEKEVIVDMNKLVKIEELETFEDDFNFGEV